MKANEEYWVRLVKEGKIEIDFNGGEVYSNLTKKKHLLNARLASGYLKASAGVSRKNRNYILLHRLIWIIANGEIPEGMEINHKNGNKSDNRLLNLELVTKSENAIHSIRVLQNKTGSLKGQKSPSSKITDAQVEEIKNLYGKGVTIREMEKMFPIKKSQIYNIVSGKSRNGGANHSCGSIGQNGSVE